MKRFIVYTVLGGYTYCICHSEAEGYYVKGDAADHEILKLTTREAADKIASDNTNDEVEYKVKEVTL